MPQIIQIDKTTWRFEDSYVRFFLLEGEDKAVLIDSGVSVPDAADIAKTLTDKPLMLLNTHGDGDHVSGTGAFDKIHIHELDYINCDVKARFPNTALVAVNDGDIIDLGNRPLKIIHIPGHTKGSVAILDVNKRVLYAGDSVQKGHIFMFGKKRNPAKFEASLDKLILLKDEYDCIFASHDDYMVSNDHVEKVKEAWRQVVAGELDYEMVDLHGCRVKAYTTPDCGFYVE